MTFTTFDIIVLTVISISSLFGLYRGFIYTVITILGFIGSILLTMLLYSHVQNVISHYLHNKFGLMVASGASSYVISLIICSLATSRMISIFVSDNKAALDRLFGLLLGFLRGALLVGIFFIILVYLVVDGIETDKASLTFSSAEKYPEWLKKSSSTIYLQKVAADIMSLVPENVIRYIETPANDEGDKEESDMTDSAENQKKDDNYKSGTEKLFENSLQNSINNDLP